KDPATLKKRLKAAQQKLKQHAQYEAYRKARAAQTRAEVRLAELEKEQSCLVKNQKKFRALAKAHKEMLELPREPKPFEGKKLELKVLRRMMEELVERRALLKQLAPHLETIIAVQQLTQEDLKKVEVAE
ncbi:hypothetical protein P0E61_14075, partial [Enterococcus faecalis]